MNKKGVKWLFYPFFGQKLAEFVLFLKTIIYNYINARKAPIDCWQNSIGQKWTLLERSPPGLLAQYLNSFRHSLIIDRDGIENIKDLEGM